MKKYIAVITMLTVGAAHAGVVALNSSWNNNGLGGTYTAESAAGYTVDYAPTNSASQNRYAYQTVADGDFVSEALNIGETATLSFILTTFDVTGPSLENEGFRIALWDQGSGASISARMDWDNPAGQTSRIGWKPSGAVETAIGSTSGGGQTVSADIPSGGTQGVGYEGWSKKLDYADVALSLTRTAASTYDVTLNWEDVTITDTYTGLTIDSIDALGIRLHSDSPNGFTVSDLSLAVIPEPATLGLIGLFGGAMLAVRRLKQTR